MRTSVVALMVKCLPTIWETWVQSLGWEDPLEKEMATHSSTLAWKIPWTEKHGSLQFMGSLGFGHDWATSFLPWNIFFICENIGSSTVQFSLNTILLLPRVRKWFTEDKIQWKFGALWGGKGHFPGGTSNKEPAHQWMVPSLGQEDLLEEGMTIHSSILIWKTPRTEKPGGLQSIGHTYLNTTEAT